MRRIRPSFSSSMLAAASGTSDVVIAGTRTVGASTVYRTKRRFVEEGLEAALSGEARPGVARKLEAKEEALLVATACAAPPAGRARWTLALLAGEMVRLTEHASLSTETVRRRLAENKLKPWQKKMWCIPKVDAEFVARMENVLDLYAEGPDEKRPVVCFDETPRQLIGEARVPALLHGNYPLTPMDMAVEQAAALADAQSELASTLEQIRAVHHEGGYVDPAFDVAHDAWVNYEAAHTALGEIIYAGGSLKNFYVCQAQTTLALERTRLLREWFRLDPPEKPPAK